MIKYFGGVEEGFLKIFHWYKNDILNLNRKYKRFWDRDLRPDLGRVMRRSWVHKQGENIL